MHILPVPGGPVCLDWFAVFCLFVGQQRCDLSCSMGRFRRLFPEISSSSDNATDVSISGFLTVCCSPQLPAAIAHHVVWKPLRLTAAIHSCEVLGCLWSLHRAALPCHSLLDRSLQQGTNSWWCVGLTGIFTQGLEWNPRFFHKAVEKAVMVSPKIAAGESKQTQMELSWFEIHLYREKRRVVGKEGESGDDKKIKGKINA